MATGADYKSGALGLWLCNGLVLFLILLRLGLRKRRKRGFTIGDVWLVIALIFSGPHMAGDYYINKYGTPLSMAVLLDAPTVEGLDLTAQEQSNLALAGKLLIVARISVTIVLWSLKMAVLDNLGTLLRKLSCQRPILWFTYIVFGATFLASFISIFLECQGVELNWKLFPDPNKCTYNAAWIITYEIGHAMTDIVLFLLFVFLIFRAPISKGERVRLSVFGLGVTMIVVEIFRLVEGLPYTDVLLNRVLWGSVEVASAASVATLPTIYALMRLGFSESQKETAGKNNCGPRRSAIAPSVVGDEIEQTRQSRQYANIWDEPGPTEPGAQDSAHKPMPRSAIRRSVVGSVSGEGGNRDSWPKSRPLRNSLLGSRPGSRLSSRLRVGDDNLHDTLDGWIELEEVDTRVSAEEATPEPDNVDVRSGIFVATQINQEVHRVREPDQQPRIITIPQRAKVNQSPV